MELTNYQKESISNLKNEIYLSLNEPYRGRFVKLMGEAHKDGKFKESFAFEFYEYFKESKDIVHQAFIKFVDRRKEILEQKEDNNINQNQENMNTTINSVVRYNYEQCKELETQRANAHGSGHFNRDVKKTHVKRLAEGMPGSLALMTPIIVNSRTNHIMDGQHRLSAFIFAHDKGRIDDTATLPVTFVDISEEEEIDLIKSYNVNVVAWSSKDHVGFAQRKNENVQKVMQFHEGKTRLTMPNGTAKHDLCFAYVCGCSASFVKDDSKLAEFEIDDYTLEVANTMYNEMTSILEILEINDSTVEKALLSVWRNKRNLLNINDWLRGFRKYKNRIKSAYPKKKGEWDLWITTIRSYINDSTNNDI